MTSAPFLIAGGGIAGLGASLGLARIGRPSRLFEQAAAFDEVGAGLQMSPNGVRALQWLGAWEAVEPSCVIPSEIHVRNGMSGALLQRIRLGKPFEAAFGAPYRVCHRADLLRGLVTAAQARGSIELNTGTAVVSGRPAADGAVLAFENGVTARGAGVIAADGIRSRLRQAVCGKIDPVVRSHAIFRGLIPFSGVPPEIEADCVTLWLCPGGHVVHYPVSNWNNFNIVAAVDSNGLSGDWGKQADGRDVRDAFADADETLSKLVAAPRTWLKWQAADLPALAAWSKENIALAGDAAHAALPYLAQGAVMALEDACVLARRIAGDHSVQSAFASYEAIRRPRAERIQAESRHVGQLYHTRGLKALGRDLAFRLLGTGAVLRRNRWIYDWTM